MMNNLTNFFIIQQLHKEEYFLTSVDRFLEQNKAVDNPHKLCDLFTIYFTYLSHIKQKTSKILGNKLKKNLIIMFINILRYQKIPFSILFQTNKFHNYHRLLNKFKKNLYCFILLTVFYLSNFTKFRILVY
jgi:hypothetical protein